MSGLARLLLRDPAEAARRLVALDLSRQALWVAFALFAVLTAILIALHAHLILRAPGATELGPMVGESLAAAARLPFQLAIGQAAFFLAAAAVLDRLGRAFGGTGDFRGALTVTVAIMAVFTAVMAAQLLAAVTLPGLGLLFALAFVVFLLWHLPGLVMGLHGFRSRGAVLVVMLLAFVAIQLALAVVATFLSQLSA